MKNTLAMVITGGILMSLHGIAQAEPKPTQAPAVDGFYLHQVAVLESDGYTSIHAVPSTTETVAGFDAGGSEVVVRFDPDQGTIEDVDYVHPADR